VQRRGKTKRVSKEKLARECSVVLEEDSCASVNVYSTHLVITAARLLRRLVVRSTDGEAVIRPDLILVAREARD
jgi:hypothetical protein